MAIFNVQERDLDLMILEELHSDTGFADWLSKRIGLEEGKFKEAHHSVSAKANAKWGETDVLAFFETRNGRVAILIEDKIGAVFADRQAERYHERAVQLVAEGRAISYRTVLIAPASYLAGVPKSELWSAAISIEEIAGWFALAQDHHARWRLSILQGSLHRVARNSVAADDLFMQFSRNFSEYLNINFPQFSHTPSIRADRWGLSIKYTPKIKSINLWWKVVNATVDLALEGKFVGKIEKLEPQAGVGFRLASNGGLATDIASIQVSAFDWSQIFSDQLSVANEVVAACQRLRSIALDVASNT